MKASKAIVIIFFMLTAATCATEKVENRTQPEPANEQTITNTEPPAQPLTQKILNNKECLTYEPTVVELKGKLIVRTFYGPPTYGEDPKTDSKEALPILLLSKPVNVCGDPDPDAGFNGTSVNNVRKMELVLTIPHKKLIGKYVTVKGTLFHAFTGHHHTDVLMRVQSISLMVSK